MKPLLSPAMQGRKKELEAELFKIADIEAQEIINRHYPAIKKKYEGKYFKYENGYNDSERWLMYTKVVEIKPDDVYDTHGNGVTSHFTGYTFQVTSDGNIQLSPEKHGYVHSLGKQISEREFNAAWNKMIDKMNQFK